MGKLKIIGLTISITWVMFIALALFVKSVGILFNSWFVNNALIITIITGIIVFAGLITGAIALGSLANNGGRMLR